MSETAVPQNMTLNSVETGQLELKQTAAQTFEVTHAQSGETLATVKQPESAPHRIEFFNGKGGFAAVLSATNGLKYFALPGSTVELGGIELNLPGQAITSNPSKSAQTVNRTQPQQHTTQATILGAGLATRFEPVSGENTQYAKPSVPLAGKRSVIRCIVDTLQKDGFSNIIINTFFKPDSLKGGLADTEGVNIRYIDEDAPSGTAGGLRKMILLNEFKPLLDAQKPLLVVQGDAVSDVNLSGLVESHVRNNALLTLGCQVVPDKDVSKFGIIVTDRQDADGVSGNITGFQEKPALADAKSRLGNTGFYVLSPAVYPIVKEIYKEALAAEQVKAKQAGQLQPDSVALDFANDIFPGVLKRVQSGQAQGAFWAQAVEGYWSDIGNPTQYLETVHDLYAGKVDLGQDVNDTRYYREGVIFWPEAQALADQDGARLCGNVVVAKPFSAQA